MAKTPEVKDILECYSDYTQEWQDIRDEAAIDMRYVDNNPWEEDDKTFREDNGRPCMSHDEINQYLNQAINNVRQNKLGIEITPEGLDDQGDAVSHREGIIRGIEERCDAPSAYITGYENAIQRGYGFAEITTGYDDESLDTDNLSPANFNQHISILRAPNPDVYLIPSSYKKADASDIEDAFKVSLMSLEKFKKKYPKAEKKDFTDEDRADSRDWIRENDIQIGTYWKIHKTTKKLVMIDGGEQGPIVKIDDGNLQGVKVLKYRDIELPEVIQYILNGVEILLETPWAGTRIPVAACFGKELFVPEKGTSKRKLISMVRAARDPQMALAFLVSQEMEEAGLTPKVSYIGYKGQFASDPGWKEVHKVPHPFLEVDPMVDAATGQVLPLPIRNPFTPNFQAYEIAKDSARRAIQAAMGITPLPTAAQRSNQKSGVALERIEQQQSVGTFHFTDNYKLFIKNIGWQVNQILNKTMDTARNEPIVKKNGERGIIRVNDPVYAAQNPDKDHVMMEGNFGTVVTAAPNFESQRAEASAFVDNLLQNIQMIAQLIGPQGAAKIMALGVKLKEIGPLGAEMADLLSPKDGQQTMPPEAMQAIQQAKLEAKAIDAHAQQLQQQVKELEFEKQAKLIDNQGKMAIVNRQIEGQVAVAEVNTKSQRLDERIKFIEDIMSKVIDHHNAMQQAQQQAAAASQQSAQDQAESLQSGDQGHQQALEQGAQSHDQALEQQDQAGQQQAELQAQAAEQQPEANSGS